MIKYYKDLENRKGYTIPLVEYGSSRGYMYLRRTEILPPHFLEKYGRLLKYLDKIAELIIQYGNKKDLNLTEPNFSYFNGLDMNEYYRTGEANIAIEEFCQTPELLEKIITQDDVEFAINKYSGLLDDLIFLNPSLAKKWGPILRRLDEASKEIEKYNELKYETPKATPRNQKIKDSWFITCYGDPYNTGNGHKQTDLTYIFRDLENGIKRNDDFEGWSDSILESKKNMEAEGFVTYFAFSWYFKSAYWFPVVVDSADIFEGSKFKMEDLISNKCDPNVAKAVFTEVGLDYFGTKSFDRRIIQLVLGVLSAQAGLVNFFEYFQKNVKNPKKEFNKLMKLVKKDVLDILVRCAGFYKVETSLRRVITTCSLTPFEDLQEYVRRGWDVYFLPPIIINKEKGAVEVLDIGYNIAESILEKDQKKYELRRSQEVGYGKIHY